jgi:hypothetical protein
MEELWGGLAVYSAFVELPLVHQQHPGMQRRMRDAAGEFYRGLQRFVGMLERDDAALWDRLEAGRSGIGDAEAVLREADDEARKLGVNGRARRRLHALMRQSLHELRGKNVRDAALEFTTRARASEPTAIEADAATVTAVTEARAAWKAAGVEGDCGVIDGDQNKGLRILGIVLTSIGGTICLIGLLIMIAYYTCFCIGALIILGGLAFLIPGIIVLSKANRQK